jgi:PAS domain S-box-containing protein
MATLAGAREAVIRTMRSRLMFAFAGAFLLLAAIVAMTYRSTQRLIQVNQRGQTSIHRLLELERTYASVADAETGQRGFLLTGDDTYLEPFHSAVEQIPIHRQRLDSLGMTGPESARFDALVDRKVSELGATIEVFRTQGADAARQLVMTNEGRAVMDSLRTALTRLTRAERRELTTLIPLERERARTAILTITALSLLGLVILGSLFVTLWRYLRDRQRAVAELEKEQVHLEERVRERTAAVENELRHRLSAERARTTVEAQHRSAVEQIRDHAIFTMAADGTATSWNEGVRRVLGYQEAEFIGLPVEAIFLPEDVQARVPWRELADAVEHGVAGNDRWMLRKDGTRFFARGSTSALFNEQKELIGFSKVMRDQTASRRTEEALRASETRYRLVATASREAIWDWDLTTGHLTWNEGIEHLLGYDRQDIPPTVEWWHQQIHPDERQRVRDSMQTAIDRGENFWTADYRIRRADGQYAMVTDRGVIARDERGRAARMLGTIADVTERRRTDEKLSQAQRMEAVGRLAGGIAHDLNNMLTAIVGFSTLLDQDFDPADPRRRDVAEIMKAADRSSALTRSLLAFARREIIHPQALDLNRIVMEMGRMLQPAMGESIKVEMALEPIAGTVFADRGRLEQVILNIALNARDAMPAGGRLSIATRSVELAAADAARHPGTEVVPGRYVKLTITDTGQGMEAQTLARIFEPFFTTKEIGEGTGLGLSTVYGTVKQAGGFVWAYSEPGHGSAFSVYLPETAAASASEAGTGDRVHSRGGSESVLVVEDEDVVRELAERILAGEGYRCITASSGAEAMALLEGSSAPVDLVITDIVMPGMSGRDLARAIRERYPEARILYTSGFTDDEVVRRGLMDIGQPFLEKPWSGEQLLARVRELLDDVPDRTGWNQVLQDESARR